MSQFARERASRTGRPETTPFLSDFRGQLKKSFAEKCAGLLSIGIPLLRPAPPRRADGRSLIRTGGEFKFAELITKRYDPRTSL
jgi:hypothetical protein